MEKVLGHVPPEGLHLDVGTGRGDGTLVMARRKRTVAVEYGRRSLRLAAAKGLTVVQGSACALPFADAAFDSITCLDVIEHIPDAGRALKEMRRVLKPGGVLVVQTPSHETVRLKRFGIFLHALPRKTHALALRLFNMGRATAGRLLRRLGLLPPLRDAGPPPPRERPAPQPYDAPVRLRDLRRFFDEAGLDVAQRKFVYCWHPVRIIWLFSLGDLFILRPKSGPEAR